MKRGLVVVALLLAGCGGGGGGPLDGGSVFDRVDAAYEDVGGVELSARIPGGEQVFRVRTTAVLEEGRVVAKELVRTLDGEVASRLLVTSPAGPSYEWQSGTRCWLRHPPLERAPAEELTQLGERIFHTETMEVHDALARGPVLLVPVDFEVPTESTWGDLPVSQRGGYEGNYVLEVERASGRVERVVFLIGSAYGERAVRPRLRYAVRTLDRAPALSAPQPLC